MRVLSNRVYWGPRARNARLFRLAFVGDSYTFGQGVAPDETLPARCERYLNEVLAPRPIEAVNLGVNGYNIWNAWTSFRRAPPVYDGLVLSLCSNDAQMFGRTYRLPYSNDDAPLWRRDHPFYDSVRQCFGEIACYKEEFGLKVAVCYYNFWQNEKFISIGEQIAQHCRDYHLPYIDFFAHFKARKLSLAELLVSDADYHGSALANDAAARHLTQALRDARWLERGSADEIANIPREILLGARDMTLAEAYPPDAALRWAASALQSAERGARRLVEPDSVGRLDENARHAAATLDTARTAWHVETRIAAICDDFLAPDRGMAELFNRTDEEALRIAELCNAARIGNLENAIAVLPAPLPVAEDHDAGAVDLKRLYALAAQFDELLATIEAAPSAHRASWLQTDRRIAQFGLNLAELLSFARDARSRLSDLTRLVGDEASVLLDQGQSRGQSFGKIARLLRNSVAGAVNGFDLIRRRLALAVDPVVSKEDYTTIEVQVETNLVEGRNQCTLYVQVHSKAPHRLPLKDQAYFLPDGKRYALRFRFAVFYSGQIVVGTTYPAAVADLIKARIVKIDVYNAPTRHQVIAEHDLAGAVTGRFVSQEICLV